MKGSLFNTQLNCDLSYHIIIANCSHNGYSNNSKLFVSHVCKS